MSQYDNYSRDELIRRIEELESTEKISGGFREQYAAQILDALPDMLTVLTREGVLLEMVSAEQTNHVGVPSGELAGRNICDLLSSEAYDNVKNNLENVFATGCGSSSHHDITLDGKTHNYENRIFPIDDAYALCMCRDVTGELETKRELEMVKYALNNVDEEIYACSLDGTMVFANELFRLRHDIQGDISNHKVYQFWSFHGTRQQWDERLSKIRLDNGTHKYTLRFKDEQSRIVACDIMACIVFDQTRQDELVWFFGRDATQRLASEKRMKEMNLIMECIFNNIPVCLFVKDPGNDFRYLYWNRAFEEFSHIPAAKALGSTDFEIFPNPKDAEKFRHDDLDLLRQGESVTFVEEYVNMAGETRVVNTCKSLVRVENRLPLIVGVSWDITDMKNAELEVVEARIRAEESDKLKSAFLANMSHEIRTPLNAIVGFSRLIGAAETEEEKQHFAEIIDTNSELLLQLVNDILDLSKIESGSLTFKYKLMDLNELCRSEFETLKDRTKPGVKLVFEQKYPKAMIVSDQNRLAQVITNLISNASKFTDEGEICFGFNLNGDKVDFYVRDTGMGIPPDKLERIFDRFIKLNDFVSGTGLGLAISKMIIEKMSGTIGVESEQGHGTMFYFSIPQLRNDDQTESHTLEFARKDSTWSLLVAEDSDSNYKLIEAILSRGFSLVRAHTGEEAVALFDKLRPDAVLMDIRLPVVDGLEATRRILALSPEVPVIAMSAYAFSSEIEAARAAGCCNFLAKPLSQYSLHKALNSSLINLKK